MMLYYVLFVDEKATLTFGTNTSFISFFLRIIKLGIPFKENSAAISFLIRSNLHSFCL